MNRTYGLFFFIVKNTMFILNVIIVLFYVAVIAITTKYIIGNDLARSFLDKVMYMPTAPVYIISGSVGLLLCLAYCVYYREFNNIRNKTINYLYSLLEVVISVILIFLIYLSYNGIILFVFCDCMYHLKKGLKYQVLLVALGLIYLLANYEIVTYFYPLVNIEEYFLVYDASIRNCLIIIKRLLEGFNIILFIIFMIIYILKQIQENEYISKKLSMVAMINKKMQKYVIVTEKFGEKNERKRLARELHDTIGHALAGMAVGVDACITMIDKNPQLAKAQLKIISKAIRKGMKDVRNSLNKMRPDFLQQYRLKEAIEKMKEEISDVTDLKINLNYQIDEIGFDTKIEDILFRVIQESITNSIRHGLATVVDIDIYKENNLLCLKIKDNGKGCKAINYGFGLKQMVERVSQIRGDINFYSENGFTTEIKIPL
ncbi:sensor histidine kinase [Megamonas funiformis]|jgi:signal transduction histidine kinase|uniref:sensor histidine kinase n=1 Tax=Megamonas funiformis TaxID=437897 RepID=UPI0018739704|nr:sensor histidine kinase [Megamonas funiformis]MBE5059567.1 sensor histidine kinase [Megamonas funiformis]MBM6650285.1 sensor histidine kinase [Megamonas funiformis]